MSRRLMYADDLALVIATLEDPRGGLETWKGAFEWKGLKGNVKKTKMKVTIK